MKYKFFWLVMTIGLMGELQAQTVQKVDYSIPKGAKVVTGNATLNYIKNGPYYRSLGFGLTEQTGCFVAKNFSVGNVLGYSFQQGKIDYFGGYKHANSHSVTGGISMRYYKMFTGNFGFFGQWNNTFTATYTEDLLPKFKTSLDFNFSSVLSPNLVYFFTPKLGMEMGFGSLSGGYSQGYAQKQGEGNLNLDFNPDLRLGLSLYLGRH